MCSLHIFDLKYCFYSSLFLLHLLVERWTLNVESLVENRFLNFCLLCFGNLETIQKTQHKSWLEIRYNGIRFAFFTHSLCVFITFGLSLKSSWSCRYVISQFVKKAINVCKESNQKCERIQKKAHKLTDRRIKTVAKLY